MGCIGLAHHITEVDAIVRNMLTGVKNWPSVLRIDLHGPII